jgi:hypothetical protein
MKFLSSAQLLVKQLLREQHLLSSVAGELEDIKLLCAAPLVNRLREDFVYDNIHDAEFKVFSQFGDDGIIQYLVNRVEIPSAQRRFIEFGVENYRESNTRFLLLNNNWSGLILDGSAENINSIKNDQIYWKHDLIAVHSFIDRDNINELIAANGFAGEVGILSIDIDGNDYWVWEAIEVAKPAIVIIEYNSVFGAARAVAVPYDPLFNCTKAHYSNLFWGSSLKALCQLGKRKGYAFVGADSHGNNAYFVAQYRLGKLKELTPEGGYVGSKFRESRDEAGQLTYVSGRQRLDLIKDLEVFDFEKGVSISLRELTDQVISRNLGI